MKTYRRPNVQLFIFILIFLSSCTPIKKLIYLQENESKPISDSAALIKSVQLKSVPYRLKPDDRLLVNIFSLTDPKVNFLKDPQMELRVDDTGKIQVPVIGAVAVEGLTVKEAELKLKQVATEYL